MCPTVARIRERFTQHELETAVRLNHPLYVPNSALLVAVGYRRFAGSYSVIR
jgi:hypothetical protein